MPPFAGFIGKVMVFLAALESGWVWLAVVGVLNSIVGLYYYLNVLKSIYLFRMESQDEEKHPIRISRPMAAGIIVLVIGILLLGTLFAPWFDLAASAASLF
jgi:NADH-quinone oxidoreductase subunit N